MNNLKKFSLVIVIIILIQGCNKDLLNTIPNDRLSTEIYWKTDQDAILSANSVYTYLEGAADFTNWDAMSDIGHVTLTWRGESAIEKGSYDATLPQVLSIWTQNYTGIQNANIFLDNVDRIKTSNSKLIERLKAEVKTLRAFYYIRLVQLFGDVPLITKEITLEESRSLTRTSETKIWDFISNDLGESAEVLPISQMEKGRMTKGAALALKARAMLFANRFTEAANAAKRVMDLNVYNIYPSYKNLFSYGAENNQEVILDREYIKNIQSNNIFALTTPNSLFPKSNSFVPTKKIVDSYEMNNGKSINETQSGFNPLDPYSNRDPRLKYSIYVIGSLLPNGKLYDSRPASGTGDAIGFSENSTPTGFNVRKYVNEDDMGQPSNSGINLIFIRYAEVLLTYAEAKIELNQIDENVISAINKVRQRPDVNMPPIIINSQTKLRDVVRRERMVELAFEGLRYFDLRRTKVAEKAIPGIIYGMTYSDGSNNLVTVSIPGFLKAFDPKRDYLWPIPQREVELNPNLKQNPNW